MTSLKLCAGLLALVLALPAAARAATADAPSLVVVIVVDQLRRDRLDPALPGGLGRLAREGRVHVDAALDHATTETCPGHVSIASGRHPGHAGAPTNHFIDMESGELRYCVEDLSADARVIGGSTDSSEGRSPRLLRFDALGDWLQTADSRSRVFSVSGKDRAAVALGGRHPDGAYWFLREWQPGFTTSRYYQSALPDWVLAWNAVDAGKRVPDKWTHASATESTAGGEAGRADDFGGESGDRSRTSPHDLRDDDDETQAENVYHSPFIDEWTLSFATTLLESERLGVGPQTDLLAISLSGTDTVGHEYGPGSLESRDALLRLDGWLGDFLSLLDQRFGRDRVLVALSSDHGVLPLPEWLDAQGRLECPVEGGRAGAIGLLLGLFWELHAELSPWSWPTGWVGVSGQLTVNRELAREREVPVEQVVAVAERWLEAQPGIREAWTRQEIERGKGEIARLYRNAFDPEKSGDIAVQLEPTCIPDFFGEGTTHGSPYAYDREVPIVFWGAGVEAARVDGPAATVDIAPSLAARLGIAAPDGLDGRNLFPGLNNGESGESGQSASVR